MMVVTIAVLLLAVNVLRVASKPEHLQAEPTKELEPE